MDPYWILGGDKTRIQSKLLNVLEVLYDFIKRELSIAIFFKLDKKKRSLKMTTKVILIATRWDKDHLNHPALLRIVRLNAESRWGDAFMDFSVFRSLNLMSILLAPQSKFQKAVGKNSKAWNICR